MILYFAQLFYFSSIHPEWKMHLIYKNNSLQSSILTFNMSDVSSFYDLHRKTFLIGENFSFDGICVCDVEMYDAFYFLSKWKKFVLFPAVLMYKQTFNLDRTPGVLFTSEVCEGHQVQSDVCVLFLEMESNERVSNNSKTDPPVSRYSS